MSKTKRYVVGDTVGVKDVPVTGHVQEVLVEGKITRYRILGADGRMYTRSSGRLSDLRPETLARNEALREQRAAIFRANRAKKLALTTVPAKDVSDHVGFFRKPGGGHVHLRVSKSSISYLHLDESKVYGVSYNGGVAVLDRERPVVLCSVADFAANVDQERQWENAMGITGRRVRDAADLISEALLLTTDPTLCQKLREALRSLRD